MASPVEDAATAASDTVVVNEGDLEGKHVQPDLEEEKPTGEGKEKEDGKKENNLKSTLVISGVVIAVIGAVVAMVKKMKDAS